MKWWRGKAVEGSGRDLIWGTNPTFTWRDWVKPQKTSVRIASLRAKIWTRDLQIRRNVNHLTTTFNAFRYDRNTVRTSNVISPRTIATFLRTVKQGPEDWLKTYISLVLPNSVTINDIRKKHICVNCPEPLKLESDNTQDRSVTVLRVDREKYKTEM
jgi:hypothetical protein